MYGNTSHTISFTGFVGIGLKELSTSEYNTFCVLNNTNLANLNKINQNSFSSNITIRVVQYGCYYVDKTTGQYSSYGTDVLATSNSFYTQCQSNHLTQFAGGWIVLPNSISFDFSQGSFENNYTVYTTVIVLCCVYFLLLILMIYKDKHDKLKLLLNITPECEQTDNYFYEIIVSAKSDLEVRSIFKLNIYIYS